MSGVLSEMGGDGVSVTEGEVGVRVVTLRLFVPLNKSLGLEGLQWRISS